ncbi:MAG: isochorismatase family cysteine hydrolase [Candidatus Hydrothermales bacterium]
MNTKSVIVPEIPYQKGVILNSKESALIIVDMQNDFVDEKGALFVPDAKETVPVIKNLINKARKSGVKIFFTQDYHEEEDIEFPIWGKHAVKDSWGSDIIDEIKPQRGDFVIRKLRYDAFFGTPLDHLLRINNIKNLVIVGTVANICVLHTAGSAALHGYKIVIPKDAISAVNEFDYYASLRQISFLYKGIITEEKEISFE